MIYSTKITIDKERTLKLGVREAINLAEKGINIYDYANNTSNLKVTMEILTAGLKREDKDLTVDKVIDLFEESETPLIDVQKAIFCAAELGIGKKEVKLEEDDGEEKN